MRIKLYRGPMHGKTMVIPSFMPQIEFARPLPPVNSLGTYETNKIIYRPVIMTPNGHSTYSIHPDGSMYYQYESGETKE